MFITAGQTLVRIISVASVATRFPIATPMPPRAKAHQTEGDIFLECSFGRA